MHFPEKSADSPYTRLINIPPLYLFVKHYFSRNSEKITKRLSFFRQFVKIAENIADSKICIVLAPGHENQALIAVLYLISIPTI